MKAITGIVLTLLLTGMLMLVFEVQPVKSTPTTLIVPDDHAKIQWAINNASSGDTIFVKAGTYYENLAVGIDSIYLVGESAKNTTIDGNATGNVIYLNTRQNVTITDFTIRNSGTGSSGIYIYYCEKIKIKYNNITNNEKGVRLGWSLTGSPGQIGYGNNIISDNNITNNVDGVYLHDSDNNTISGNKITNNTGYGSYLFCSRNNTFYRNNITNNGYGAYLWGQIPVSTNNTFYENNITNNGYGAYLEGTAPINFFYHNNFVNNTILQAHDGGSNVWDNGYPSGGNYWSNYTGVDVKRGPGQDQPGSDGIGDTPHFKDNYPLMNPWPCQITPLLPPVGGVWIPVDKFALLAPYIALASIILVATAATAIYVKRAKPRKKKQ